MRISAYMFDASSGRSAVGVPIRLFRFIDHGWGMVCQTETSGNGRIPEWETTSLETGSYRIVINSGEYFSSLGSATACSEIAFDFRINRDAGFQVHVIFSPYYYGTYFTISNPAEPDCLPIAAYYDTED